MSCGAGGVLLTGEPAEDGQAELGRGAVDNGPEVLAPRPGTRVGIFECRADHTC